jgi:hypothetical protein
VQFSGIFDTSGSSSNNNHVHQPVDFLLGLIFECGGLDTLLLASPEEIREVSIRNSQSSNLVLILSASLSSFKKHAYFGTPSMPKV